jgi:anthranilate synthase component II
MKILILDNYDSFTYNLYHMVEGMLPHGWELAVKRNDAISLEAVNAFDKIIISPGPGLPRDAGITCSVIENYFETKSILGVCLGMQAIGEVFGGKLRNLQQVQHGVAIRTHVVQPDEYLFNNCPGVFDTGRYHSWVVDSHGFPECLEITATDIHGQIMALRHRQFDVRGVQFHPESIMTAVGKRIMENWLNGPK